LSAIDGRFSILYTSNVMGEIDACGCATKKLGGVAKRVSLFSTVSGEKNTILYLDTGDHFSKTPTIPQFMEADLKKKVNLLVETLKRLHVDALVPGERDFAFGLNFLLKSNLPYVAANLVYKKDQKTVFSRFKIVTIAGYRIGITGILSGKLGEAIKESESEIAVTDAQGELASVVGELKEKVDLIILLSHQSFTDTEQLTREFPQIGYVLSGHASEYLENPKPLGSAWIFEAEMRGKYVGRIDVEIKQKEGLRNNLSERKKAQTSLWFAEEELRGLKVLSKIPENTGIEALKKTNAGNVDRLKLIEKYENEVNALQTEISRLPEPATGGFWHELIPIDEEIADDPVFKKKMELLEK
jgi:2',3'-cyclic-nucleotide 2'-phosphodiesterase (5'-nucleotidase family)